MITQILGVALISLLTITPTIQQNNIEQLIAPNIDIQPMQINYNNNQDRLYIKNQFSYAVNISSGNATDYINHINLYTNATSLLNENSDLMFSTSTSNRWIFISDTNFYVYDTASGASNSVSQISGTVMRQLLQDYYFLTKGVNSTNQTFSFTQSGGNLPTTSSFYTYTLTGTGGTLEGRIYLVGTIPSPFTVSYQNTTVTVPAGTSLQNIVEQYLIPTETTPTAHSVLYYAINQSSNYNNQVAGTYNVNLITRYSYGNTTNQTITINVTAPDTTPPTITSITGNPTNWTNQNVILTIQATDNVALNSQAYSFNNGSTYQTSNQATFTTNQFVNVRVRDSSNNFVNQQVTINRIDKQSPSINLAGNWTNTFELGELTSNNDLYNYLSISDGASGINSSLTTISNFNYNQAGTYTNVQVSATDNAGNTFVNTLPTITITQATDTSPPTISGSTVQTRVFGSVTTQGLIDAFTISDPSGVVETRIQRLDNTIVTSWNDFNVGSHQLRVYARDTVGNIGLYQFELVITAPPAPDTIAPVITGPLLVSSPMGTYTSTSEILALYTITDNVAVAVQQLIGTIDFETQGEYQVTISATDTSNNTSIRNVLVRIRSEMSLDGYNPITDLLSGIFGGVLSLIFTIGTINLLGFRLLDAMAIIILGGVIYLVYKVIRK
jgi:hypothetical protein